MAQTPRAPDRLTTASGVGYALMEGYPQFQFTADNATATEKYRLLAANLIAFIDDTFPAPSFLQNFIQIGNRRRMPGNEFLISKTVSIEPQDMSKPIDPFGADPSAPAGTYGEFIVATITYETVTNEDDNEKDPNNPETFLTHSVNIGGEFLTLNGQGLQWVNPNAVAGAAIEFQTDSQHPEFADPLNFPGAQAIDVGAAPKQPNKDFHLPFTKIIPTIEHSLQWKEVVDPPWQAIRELLGKVNNAQLPLFFNAVPDSVLFLGATAKQEFTARANVPAVIRKPWSLDFKFSEKRGSDGNTVITWNHFWRPQTCKWEILLKPDNTKAYEAANFMRLFQRGWNQQ